jgi:hypothetical protein
LTPEVAGGTYIIAGPHYTMEVKSMPHVVLEGPVDMDEVFRRFKPVFVKSERGILKATDAYMDRAKRTIIVDSLAIEGGEKDRFLMAIALREDGLVIRLFEVPEVQRTEGVKQVLAETAKQLLGTFPDLKLGETNLVRYLD